MTTYKNSCRICGKPAKPGDRLALGLAAIRHRGCGHEIPPHPWTVAPDGVSLLWRGDDDGDDRLDAPALDAAYRAAVAALAEAEDAPLSTWVAAAVAADAAEEAVE